ADEASKAAAISASYAVVTAPFAGTVTERLVDPGVMAAPGAVLLTHEDTSLFRFEVSIDEARAQTIGTGERVGVLLDGARIGGWQVGRVSELARVDSARHSFLVKIDLPGSPTRQSGVFGRARFNAGERTVTAAPLSAIIRRGQLTFVFVVDGAGLARLRPVTTGDTSGGLVEILAGVTDGEDVVDRPPPGLTDGAGVTD